MWRTYPSCRKKNLLGLGVNFCLKYTKPGNKYEETFDILKKDIRRIYFFSDKPEDSSRYIKNIYIPSKWEFDPAEEIIEDQLLSFERELKNAAQRFQVRRKSNITKLQLTTLKKLHKNDNFIVAPSDKNLGPVIMERYKYIKRAIKEHLGDATFY